MRIIIIATGSRGDVQPYIALGQGFQTAGHQVRFVTHENFADLVQAHRLEFWPVPGDVQAIAQSQEMQTRIEKGNFVRLMAKMASAAKENAVNLTRAVLTASQDADVLLGGFGGMFVGVALAEKFNLPFIQAYYVPFTPTREFSGALTPRIPTGFNRLSHQLTRQMLWQGFRSADRTARLEVLDLPAAPFMGPFNAKPLQGMPVLYGYSPAVIPRPMDWDQHNHVTGYWFLDEDEGWEPSPALETFLADGPPPVYIGFGSMSSRNPEEIADIVLKALQKSGQRAVLFSGWGGLGKSELPASVFMTEAVPHAWLFPRMAAVVHHGGAGTTSAGFRAGVPSVVIPFFGDQPFWGQRVVDLGVGPQPIPRKKLSVDGLAQAISIAVNHAEIRQRAADLGAKIQAEDGVARAVEIVQRKFA